MTTLTPRAGCRQEFDGRWSVSFGEAGTRFSGLTQSSAEAIVARFSAPGADPQRVEDDVRRELARDVARRELYQTELPKIILDARLRAELAEDLVEARARVSTVERWLHARQGDHDTVDPADLRPEPLLAVLPGHAPPLSDWPTFGEKLPPLARGYLLTWNGDTVDVWGWGTSARRTRYNDLVHVESDSGARQCWCSITDRWLLIPGGAP